MSAETEQEKINSAVQPINLLYFFIETHRKIHRVTITKMALTRSEWGFRVDIWLCVAFYLLFGFASLSTTSQPEWAIFLTVSMLWAIAGIYCIRRALPSLFNDWYKTYPLQLKRHVSGYRFIRFLMFKNQADHLNLTRDNISGVLHLLRNERALTSQPQLFSSPFILLMVTSIITVLAAGIGLKEFGAPYFALLLFILLTVLFIGLNLSGLFKNRAERDAELELFIVWLLESSAPSAKT